MQQMYKVNISGYCASSGARASKAGWLLRAHARDQSLEHILSNHSGINGHNIPQSADPASSVCYARSGRYMARTQDVEGGLGPQTRRKSSRWVGGLARTAVILPSRACSEAGIGRTKYPSSWATMGCKRDGSTNVPL